MSADLLEQYRARLRDSLAIIEKLRAKADAADRSKSEPLAIVGLSCRFPGGGDGPAAYWESLARGVDAVREIPADRWPSDAIPGDKPEVRRAALLDRVDGFDADFFGISPREAESLDPQQRLLLEVVWEALEDAGERPSALAGGPVGVFVGLNSLDYQHRLILRGNEHADAYSATGNLLSTAGGRISYTFGFQGPCISVDTACSSSLVSVALACQSLRAGECDVAIAGGVTLLLSPYMMALAAGMAALSPDGRCKTLDARANGFVRGEGCGMIVLKRLSDAQRDGDRVRALIRGWAVNQDGRSTGLTAPNVLSQQALLRRALDHARVAPHEVGYVEMHGTGTPLGDPIEAEALREVLGRPRADGSTCVLGAVKTNLGHLEAAAGVAGLVKIVLAMEHEAVPPNLHFRRLNPRITLDAPFVIPTAMVPFARGDRRRVAGVSSFGISGTNAHVVLEEAPAPAPRTPAAARAAEILVLSARSEAALDAAAARLRDHVEARPDLALGDLAFSLATTRSALPHRLAVAASSREALIEALAAAAEGRTPSGAARGVASARGKLAFVFTGQGAQAPGMGRGLYDAWPAFREAFDQCAALLDRDLDRPIRSVMWADPGSPEAALLDRTGYAQPALFALEIALAALWRSWGVDPDLLAGHSVGEIAAACVAGVFSLEDAAKLLAARARLMDALPPGGAMASIEAPEAEVAQAIAPHAARVSIAAINSPSQVVIAGAADPVQAIAASFSARGVRTRALRVSHAFHSPLMDPMLDDFRRAAEAITYRAPDRPLVSNLTGAVAGPEIASPAYWVRHVREAVRFGDGVSALSAAGAGVFVEIGPKATLLGVVPDCLPGEKPALVPSLRAGRSEAAGALEALGALWAGGAAVRFPSVLPPGAARVPLPTYAWQRERYWIDIPRAAAARSGDPTGHPLLGVHLPVAGAGAVFEALLSAGDEPWLRDHRVADRVVVPGAAIAEMVRAAAHEADRAARVSGLVLQAPLVLPEAEARRVQVVLTAGAEGPVTAAVYSRPADASSSTWVLHATAAAAQDPAVDPARIDLAAARARCAEALDPEAMYARFADLGITYGPAFRGVRALWRGDGEALAEVALPPGAPREGYGVSPAILDAAFQSVLAALPAAEAGELLMPFEIGAFAVYAPGVEAAWVHVRIREGAGLSADVTLVDDAGAVLVEVNELRLQRADRRALRRGTAEAPPDALHRLAWRETPLPAAPAAAPEGAWILVAAPHSALATDLARRLAGSVRTDVAGLPAALAAAPPAAGVICLWETLAGEDVPAAAARLSIEALAAVQALRGRAPSRLLWVTQGAVAVAAGDLAAPDPIALAPLWGLGRTVMVEHRELRCALIDLDGQPGAVDALIHEIAASDGEDQIALREGRRYAARLVRAEARAAAAGPVLPAPGTVLVTGGLGALGLHVARWLAGEGVPHLVLTGRRGLETPGAAAAVADLEALGARVTVAAADVADREALAAVLRDLPEHLPLRGVVHAAGVLDDGVLAAQTPDRFARVLSPKVRGAWNLHRLTEGADLAFFLLFSSLAGALGSAGQGSYAAANSFLDALAAHRQAIGLPAQSLAFGAWSEGGMAAALDDAQKARLARQGMGVLSPSQGIALIQQALRRPDAHLGVGSFDLRLLGRSFGAAVPPVWRALVQASAPREGARAALSARLAALPEARREGEVRALVQTEVARVLSLGSAAAVPVDRPLQELGLDSLMALELRDALGQRVGAALPATLAFNHPTAGAVTRFLLDTVLAAAGPEAKTAAAKPAAAHDEPIAVVGMSCRLPGGVTDAASFWRLLDQGLDAISEVPRSRWDIDAFYDPDPDAPGKMITRSGGFVSDIDQFDPAFFGISPREAANMDPQQRLLLETSWEALESAGIVPDRLMGSDTGVFVGLMYQEYASLRGGLDTLDGYVSTGSAASVASGRISYVLGLKGPSLTVDTACSSSLVTVHLACQALRQGECRTALAGGAALMLTPSVFVEFSRLRGLAIDGRCKTFSAAADGVAWSEGCGMLVLKRLSDAQRDGDRILGVIRGSAVNQDGRSNGLTAPNGPSQEAVIRRALAQSGLSAADLDYVECHGTGTALGDPIEAQALGAVMAGARPADRPLLIGSVKTNVGHTQAAAGAAGIMKVLLSLDHESIPRSLHFTDPSPHIPWSDLPLKVASEPVPWKRNGKPRRAGVSSFGVSGTNAHIVLEEAPAVTPVSPAPDRSASLFVLSAKSPSALNTAAARLGEHLVLHPDLALGDVAFSLATTRSAMDHRLAIVATSRESLRDALLSAAMGETPAGAIRGRAEGVRPRVVFVFPGQGGQWLGMGRKLLAEEPVFRAALEACDAAIKAEVGWSVLDEIAAEEETSQLGRIDVAQPLLFAMEVALSALWRSWGVEPDAVVGHSMGEVAAAHIAGALSLSDAAAVICRRSLLLRRISGRGEMALVELTPAEAEEALRGREDRLSVAVSNGPRSTVIAGDPAALGEVLLLLEARGVFCRRVKVDVASHSPQVDALLPELREALSGLAPQAASLPMRSTVTGALVEGPELLASYWADNLRRPVRFGDVVQSLQGEGYGLFVEMSPHPVLTPAVEEMRRASSAGGAAVGSTRRDQDERIALLESLGAAWVSGQGADWDRVFGGGRRVPLPMYPWQRDRYWVEAPVAQRAKVSGHPLLGEGRTVSTLAGLRVWEAALDRARLPWIPDHAVQGVVVLPGAAMLEMALGAAAEVLAGEAAEIGGVTFVEALAFAGDRDPVAQVVTTEESPGKLRFEIASAVGGGAWRAHARGWIARAPRAEAAPLDVAEVRARIGGSPAITGDVYRALYDRGLEYGPAFQGIVELWAGEGEALGRVRLPAAAGDPRPYRIHPALLDACFQVMAGAFGGDRETWLPAEVGALRITGRPRGDLWCHARVAPRRDQDPDDLRTVDLSLADAAGAQVAAISGLVVRRTASRARRRDQDDAFLDLAWEAAAAPPPKVRAGRFVVIGGAGGIGAAVCAGLAARGLAVVHAVAAPPGSVPAGCSPLDDTGAAGVRALLRDALGREAPAAVIHLRSLEGGDALDASAFEGALARGCDSALSIVQALADMGYRDPPRLWLVTRGAQAAGGEVSVSAAQAPILGLGRVVAMEHPELVCSRVDLDPARPAGEVEALVAEIAGGDAEQEIALRGGARLVARIVHRAPPDAPADRRLRPDGSYLVTGGLGGLGLSVAGWLAARGAGHVVLAGRSGVTTEAQRQAVAAIEAAGARVTVAKADVAIRADVARVLDDVARSGMPLAGIIHAAGILDDALLLQQDRARLRRVMAPKALGALHLHDLTRDLPLDLFVLYASASGLFGAPGQGNYAAANTFLDALAHHRRAIGLPALSIDWGAFADVGLAAAEDNRGARLTARGMRSLTPDEGLAALDRLLDAGPQAAVAPLDVRQWVEFYPAAASSRLLARLLAERPAPADHDRDLLDRLTRAAPSARAALIHAFLRGAAARVLRIPEDKLDVSAPLTGLGMDSLMGLELRNRIEAALHVRVPATLAWTYPTVTALGDHLMTQIEFPAAIDAARPPEEAPAPPPVGEDDLFEQLDAALSRAARR